MIEAPQPEFGIMRKFIFGTLFVIAGQAAFAQTVPVTPDPLPASITTDQTTISADQTALATLLATLKADQAANNTTAITADQTAIKAAQATLNTDLAALRTDALAYLQTANAAVKSAAAQLSADAASGDAAKIAADRAALKAAIAQAHADRHVILAEVFKDGALHGEKIGWLKFEKEAKRLTSDEDSLADKSNPDTDHKSKHVSASDMADKSGAGKGHANEGNSNGGKGKGKSGD